MRDRVNYSGDRTGFFYLIQYNRGRCWKVDAARIAGESQSKGKAKGRSQQELYMTYYWFQTQWSLCSRLSIYKYHVIIIT